MNGTFRSAVLHASRRVRFKGKARLLTMFGMGPGRVDLVPEGVTSIRCRHSITITTDNNRDIMFRELFVHGQYGEDVLIALRNLLRPGDAFWDIGANYGFMSIFVDKTFGGKVRTIAFEPNPLVIPVLRRNLEVNGCRSVDVQQRCLSDREGTVKFYISKDHSWNATLIPDFASTTGEDRSVEVQSATIDACVRELPTPAVIKLDVEGAESLVVAGGREFLSKGRVPIVAEFNLESIRDAKKTPSEFLGMFRDLGYDAYRMPRPWVGGYRWESLRRVQDAQELPALCDIVLSKFDPIGTYTGS